jgi:hypothetical protein
MSTSVSVKVLEASEVPNAMYGVIYSHAPSSGIPAVKIIHTALYKTPIEASSAFRNAGYASVEVFEVKVAK